MSSAGSARRPALAPGDPGPWFTAVTTANPRYQFHTVAGRYVALCFFGSLRRPDAAQAMTQAAARPDLFDGVKAACFGVSVDPDDRDAGRISDQPPGLRMFWDFDSAISTAYGVSVPDADQAGRFTYHPGWVVLDPMLRVMRTAPLGETIALLEWLGRLPPPANHAGTELGAPVLTVPRVFEPELCRSLIALFESEGGADSGFMREIDGKTVKVLDHGFKRRQDHDITEPSLIAALRARIFRRLAPEIEKAFQFRPTRMERHIVACYEGATEDHFRPHRDNTTSGTAHRRFAVTINLNAEDYDGGELVFPEFGPRSHRPPTGAALVFSCSLLHTVTPMRRGRRFAFLPFLYDDAAARQREANNPNLGEGVSTYRDAAS